jgi:3-hydroxypropanoate dehydrogenase
MELKMLEIKEIFENARTCNEFSSKKISKDILENIYNLMKMGPTSGNSSPLRIVFVESEEQKEKLLSCVMEGNLQKTKSAPIVAIFAYDEEFFNHLPKLFPQNPAFADLFNNNQSLAIETASRNSSLQAAYFMIIARSFGIDCGPMSGFDGDKLNKLFFSESNFKVNFICNLGYKADSEPKYPRLPRLEFDETCKII